MQNFSQMERLGKWLGKKKPERSSRVTRSAAAPSSTRVSYNEDVVPIEMLDVLPAKSMAFPCEDFMEDADIREEFYALCANAGLTRLVTSRVHDLRFARLGREEEEEKCPNCCTQHPPRLIL